MLHDLQKELLGVAKAGATCRSVYQHALTYVREKKPDLEAHFVKTVGFGVCSTPLVLPGVKLTECFRQALNSVIPTMC